MISVIDISILVSSFIIVGFFVLVVFGILLAQSIPLKIKLNWSPCTYFKSNLTRTAIAFCRLCIEFDEGVSNFAVEHLEFDFQAVLTLGMSSTDVETVDVNSSFLFSNSFFFLHYFLSFKVIKTVKLDLHNQVFFDV